MAWGGPIGRMGAGAAVVVTTVVIGTTIVQPRLGDTPPGGDATANIWVDSDGGNCVDNASAVAYVDADACLTFDAANDTCDNGDLVRVVASATLSTQTLTGTNGRTSRCTFSPETDAGNINVSSIVSVNAADQLTFNRLLWTDQANQSTDINKRIEFVGSSSFVTCTDCDGTHFLIFDASDITISGGDWGPCDSGSGTDACLPKISGQNGESASNVLLDDITVHDISTFDPEIAHTGCLAIFGGNTGITVRNSRLYDCAVYGISLFRCCGQEWTSTHGTDITIENNWISGEGNYAIDMCKTDLSWTNVLIRFNSMRGSSPCLCTVAACGTEATYNTTRLIGNVVDFVTAPVGCGIPAAVTREYNVYRSTAGTNCGGTNTGSTTQQYASSTNDSSINLHLVDGSVVANNFVTPTSSDYALSTDYDGAARSGTPRDAGSDEQ
jgi:hypothetical protein